MPSVPREWPGETVVCIASGPSLSVDDVASVRGRARVIVVNDNYRIAPWADALYASDYKWWKAHRDTVGAFAGAKYSVLPPPLPSRRFKQSLVAQDYPEVVVLKNTGVEGLETSPDGLRTGQNSGYGAINIAIHYGATRILLLGYDLQRTGGKAHWFGDHPPGLQMRAEALETQRRWFDTMIGPLQALGVEVWNCSRQTALTCFPSVPLEDALHLSLMEAAS